MSLLAVTVVVIALVVLAKNGLLDARLAITLLVLFVVLSWATGWPVQLDTP